MKIEFEKHCTDDALELYALGRLEESCVDELEEHLLLCESCQVRLDATDVFVRAIRGAAEQLRDEPRTESPFERLAGAFRLPAVPIWAAGAACVCLLAVSAVRLRQPGVNPSPVTVSLLAQRGAANMAPAHRGLDMLLDARGLETRNSVHVVLVNATGATLEQADNPIENGRIRVRFSKPLDSGDYFVRLYLTGNQDVVREFALRAR